MAMSRRRRKNRGLPEDGSASPAQRGAPPAPTAILDPVKPDPVEAEPRRGASRRTFLGSLWPLLLVRAAHPRQGVLTALGMAAAAALAGRTTREVGLVLVTVLVGQTILGWHNDLVDEARDRRHKSTGKPVADGRLESGTVWFALTCAVLLVVPLSVAHGVSAGSYYLVSLVVGLMGNVALRRGVLSWLPWAVSFALLPAFLSYGGWGGATSGNPPEVSMVVLAALLGVGIHVLRALPGLVDDNADGWKHLPLRLALRTGATRLLVLGSVYTGGVLVALLLTGNAVGLSQ